MAPSSRGGSLIYTGLNLHQPDRLDVHVVPSSNTRTGFQVHLGAVDLVAAVERLGRQAQAREGRLWLRLHCAVSGRRRLSECASCLSRVVSAGSDVSSASLSTYALFTSERIAAAKIRSRKVAKRQKSRAPMQIEGRIGRTLQAPEPYWINLK
jgi:hypothetical protein